MSELQALPDRVFCVFVSLAGHTWVIPNAAVSDVTAFDHIDFHAGSPDWLLGHADLHGVRVPVIAAEGLHGGEVPQRTNRSRLLVLQAYGDQFSGGHYAVVSQGYPQLVTVGERAVSDQDVEDLPPSTLRAVRVANTDAIIPDFDAIESALEAAAMASMATDEPVI